MAQVKRFFPYTVISETIPVSVSTLRLDGQVANHLADAKRMVVDLSGSGSWSKMELELEVRLDGLSVERALHSGERAEDVCQLVATLNCAASRVRRGWQMTTSDGSVWVTTVTAERRELRDVAEVEACVVRSAPARALNSSLASRRAARLGASRQWRVYVDEPPVLPGRHLRVEWENFGESQDPRLRAASKSVYYLSLTESTPVLLLNAGFQGLRAILDNKARSGRMACIRDALFDSIAQPVWHALLEFTLAAIRQEGDAEGLEEWQQAVLRRLAQLMFRELDAEDAFERLLENCRKPEMAGELREKSVQAVADQVRLTRSTSALLQCTAEES